MSQPSNNVSIKTPAETQESLPRFGIFGTYVHGANRRSARNILAEFIEARVPRQIVTVNVDFLTIAENVPALKTVINTSDLAVPDGKPLVWMARCVGLDDTERVTGPDLIEAAASLSVERGTRIFFLGGTIEDAEGAKLALEARHAGVNICGIYSPPVAPYPFPEELDREMCDRIIEAKPDVLFVAFGCPKQDLWIRDHLQQLGVPVAVGIGGSFNFLSGRISRAPLRLQRLGLEWCYRLWREPRRLWRRYLLHDLPFVLRLAVAEVMAGSPSRREAGLSLRN